MNVLLQEFDLNKKTSQEIIEALRSTFSETTTVHSTGTAVRSERNPFCEGDFVGVKNPQQHQAREGLGGNNNKEVIVRKWALCV